MQLKFVMAVCQCGSGVLTSLTAMAGLCCLLAGGREGGGQRALTQLHLTLHN